MFNTTPGRLLDTPRPILDAEKHQNSNQHNPLSACEETFPSNFSSRFQHSNPNLKLELPPVEPSRRLSSSPQPPLNVPSNLPSGSEKVAQKVTPTKSRGRLEETLSAQTATPPHTASRGTRRLAAKPAVDNMSQYQGFSHGSSQQNQASLLDFSASTEIYGYPMSAPATADGNSHSKSFWDPDSHMTGMEIDFGDGINAAVEISNNSHKQSNSVDLGRSSQMFRSPANGAHFDMDANPNVAQTSTTSKPINFKNMQRQQSSYETEHSDRKESPFASPTRNGVVDPGLLFSLPATRNSFHQESLKTSSDHEMHEKFVRKPYQHQLRQSRRDQEEELRRSRPSSQASFHSRDGRSSFVSPTRPNPRARLQRSASKSNSSKFPSQANRERSSRSRERHLSPTKHQNRSSLTSIPEFTKFRTDSNKPTTRTDITLTIDAHGRARTETTIVVSDPTPRKRSASLDWIEESASESSSDEDLIIVPSRNTPFALPDQRQCRSNQYERSGNQPKRGRGRGSSVYSQSSGGPESEAETVVDVDPDDRSGDAASALRKVMEGRRIDRTISRMRSVMADITPIRTRTTRSSQYASNTGWEGIDSTPTTTVECDVDTPSTDRSGVTRCICGQPDGGGEFMIQW